jgi:hypothetical protein
LYAGGYSLHKDSGGRRFNYRTIEQLKEVVWWDIHSTNTQEEEDSTTEL